MKPSLSYYRELSYWDKLQKPFTGLHWWYRILTGTHYTFPFIKQDGVHIYWKGKSGNIKKCRILNVIESIRMGHLKTDWRFTFKALVK